jgi:hypothetical protein
MMKKIKGVQVSAVFTVELSLIISLILAVVFLQIFFAFFLHDKILMESLLTRVAVSEEKIDNQTLVQEAEMMALCLENIQFSYEEGILEDTVSYSANVQIPVYGWIHMLISKSGFKITGYRNKCVRET